MDTHVGGIGNSGKSFIGAVEYNNAQSPFQIR